jgi:hypothetical protein
MERGAAASVEELRRRLELALRLVERPPALDEVLEQVSRRGVLRGPLDWAFPAWMTYIDYAVRKIIEAFPLAEEERGQLLHFRDTLTRLLHEAWRQAKERLAAIYKAIVKGTYRIEGSRLYAPDGTWVYISKRSASYLAIHGASAETYFPDVLKLPQERLELLQLGWRASDEGSDHGRPTMGTSQPWQLVAWAAVRHGELRIYITRINLTREGASIHVYMRAKSWRQKWSKDEAMNLVAENRERGEWAPLLAMWLGDGVTELKNVLSGVYRLILVMTGPHASGYDSATRLLYRLILVMKEPWRLGSAISAWEALAARGKEAFVRLRNAAGAYGELLDLLCAHKWVVVKLATDDAFRAAYKLRARRGVVIAGVEMHLHLAGGRGSSLLARRYTRDPEKALAIAGKLKSAGLRPNVFRAGDYYIVYVATADLLWLAERDETIRRAIAHYLAEKAKSGTPKQREVARKIMEKHSPLFRPLAWHNGVLTVSEIVWHKDYRSGVYDAVVIAGASATVWPSQPDLHAPLCEVPLNLPHGQLAEVEERRGEHRVGPRRDGLVEMLERARAARGDDGNADGGGHARYELQVVPELSAVSVN